MDMITLAMAKAYFDSNLPADSKSPVVVDFDQLGLTDVVLSLFNNGGGSFGLSNIEGGKEMSEAMCKAIPLDGLYVAKLTVPGMGTMYVNPVYTLKDNYGFKSSYIDSYIEQEGGNAKFYVKLMRSSGAGNFDSAMIQVGFY